MTDAPRRSTSRIARELPPEVRDELHQRLTDGRYSYDDITEWLGECGHDISRSSVGRYAAGFVGRLQRLRERQDQARAIVAAGSQASGLELHEAANTLAMDLITQTLLAADGFEGVEPDKLLKVLAQLQQAQVQVQRHKTTRAQMLRDAEVAIQERVRAELRGQPELADRLAQVVADATRELAA